MVSPPPPRASRPPSAAASASSRRYSETRWCRRPQRRAAGPRRRCASRRRLWCSGDRGVDRRGSAGPDGGGAVSSMPEYQQEQQFRWFQQQCGHVREQCRREWWAGGEACSGGVQTEEGGRREEGSASSKRYGNTMMQKFWDSALALHPAEEFDARSDLSAAIQHARSAGWKGYSLLVGGINVIAGERNFVVQLRKTIYCVYLWLFFLGAVPFSFDSFIGIKIGLWAGVASNAMEFD